MDNNNRQCPVCRKTVRLGIDGMYLDCAHWVHASCLQEGDAFDACPACAGRVSNEAPDELDGVDYIANPPRLGFFQSVPARVWLEDRRTLDWIAREKGYTLQHYVRDGINFDDFVNNGYGWDKLRTAFKEFGPSAAPERARAALRALGVTADDLREQPQIVRDLGITPMQIVGEFGFHFPADGGPAAVHGKVEASEPWTARDLLKLGFVYDDLLAAGLTYREQIEDLDMTFEDGMKLKVPQKGASAPIANAKIFKAPNKIKTHGLVRRK